MEVTLAPSTSTTTLSVSPASVRYGQPATATVTVTGGSWAPSGAVTIRERDKVLGTADLTVDELTGTATVELPRDLATGTHRLVAEFAGTTDVEASQAGAQLRVTPAPAAVTLAADDWTVPRGSTPTVTVRVGGGEGAPAATGRVTVLLGLRSLGTYRLTDGAASVTLPAVRSTGVLTVLYGGGGGYLPGAAAQVVRVG